MFNLFADYLKSILFWLSESLFHSDFKTLSYNGLAVFCGLFSMLLLAVGFSVLFKWIFRKVLLTLDYVFHVRFFGLLSGNKLPHYASLLVIYYFLILSFPIFLISFYSWLDVLNKILYIYLVFVMISIAMAIITAGFDMLRAKDNYHDRPIQSYRQVIQILLVVVGVFLIISRLAEIDLIKIFTGLGAASAIFLLMFKDVIMGFVASVQVTSNDMVRIGDWITMPKYGADGDVIEITLTTVKVSNFDKTITTIPTYALISDSFQNWRGMIRSGGRRIKRSIIIKQSSIRYIADDELVRFRKIQGIMTYIDQRQQEIFAHNVSIAADRSIPVNGRNLTNAGLFRKYAEWYLKNHPGTNKSMTLMVRQLAPTDTGIPMELYVFTNTTNWIEHEYIMADIFDHLIAAVRYFDLQIYERQSGSDVQRVELVDGTFDEYDVSVKTNKNTEN